jgi:hypothetical protein
METVPTQILALLNVAGEIAIDEVDGEASIPILVSHSVVITTITTIPVNKTITLGTLQ